LNLQVEQLWQGRVKWLTWGHTVEPLLPLETEAHVLELCHDCVSLTSSLSALLLSKWKSLRKGTPVYIIKRPQCNRENSNNFENAEDKEMCLDEPKYRKNIAWT
jgi:hypothetical protein